MNYLKRRPNELEKSIEKNRFFAVDSRSKITISMRCVHVEPIVNEWMLPNNIMSASAVWNIGPSPISYFDLLCFEPLPRNEWQLFYGYLLKTDMGTNFQSYPSTILFCPHPIHLMSSPVTDIKRFDISQKYFN